MRRFITVALAAVGFAWMGAVPALAGTCYIYDPIVGQVTYPCPGYNDQPVPLPVAVVFSIGGPGYYSPEYHFVKLKRGGTIYFVNNSPTSTARYHGNGFDSGLLQPRTYSQVAGVSSLPVGAYSVYDKNNIGAGVLYIEP